MKYDWTTVEAWGKTGAVIIASTILYLSFSVFSVTVLPVRQDAALATGILFGFPVWIGAMCYAMLARTTGRAWGVLLAVTVLFVGWTGLALMLG